MRTAAEQSATSAPLGNLLYAVRWAIIVGVLLASRVHFPTARIDTTAITIAVVVIAVLTVAGRYVPKSVPPTVLPVLATVVDVGFVSVVIYYSDGLQSPFYALYYVTVTAAAAGLGTRGALLCAAGIMLISLGIEVSDGGSISESIVLAQSLRRYPYLFLIAIVGGALHDRVRILAESQATMRARQEAGEREMETARRIQAAQLPIDTPRVAAAQFAVYYAPAREVGGDIYDFYPVETDRIGVMVADVSGKGIAAALLVSSAKYAVRQFYSEDLAEMTARANDHLLGVTTDDMFVTMVYGILDVRTRVFRYVNAGHMPPTVISASTGEAVAYTSADLPLAVKGAMGYTEHTIQLERGDTLVLYTDGLTDALGVGIRGIEKVDELVAAITRRGLENWQTALRDATRNPQRLDDITALAIRLR